MMAVYSTTPIQGSLNQGIYSPNAASNLQMAQAYQPKVFGEGLGNIHAMEKAYYDLNKVVTSNEKNGFKSLDVEDAIKIAGDIEPIVMGSPTSMALCLLERCPTGKSASTAFGVCGLFYFIPQMFNRPATYRTTFTGLGLLDHWAKTFPKFSPFVDAYAPDWVREEITSDSFDLNLGLMPGWIKEKMAQSRKLEDRYMRRKHRGEAKLHEQQQREMQQRMIDQQAYILAVQKNVYTSTTSGPTTITPKRPWTSLFKGSV